MGLALIAKSGGGVGPRSRVLLPVQTGLKIVHYYGSTLAESVRNLANIGLPSGVFSGVNTVGPSFAQLSDTSMFLDSALTEPTSGTIIVAARSTEADMSTSINRCHFGGFQVPGGDGFSIFAGGNTVIRAGAKFGGATVTASITTTLAVMQSWNLWAATVTAGVGLSFWNLTTEQTATAANSGARGLVGNSFSHGGSVGLSGSMDVAAAVVHDEALSKGQIDLQAAVIRKFLAEVRGVYV